VHTPPILPIPRVPAPRSIFFTPAAVASLAPFLQAFIQGGHAAQGEPGKGRGIQRKWGNARSFLAIFIELLFFFFLFVAAYLEEGGEQVVVG
jgi:hypothetical protein